MLALLVLVASGLQAFTILMLGHLCTAFFLDGTHVLTPGKGMGALLGRTRLFCSKNHFVQRQFDNALGTGCAQRGYNVAHDLLFNHGLDGEPAAVVQLVDGRGV